MASGYNPHHLPKLAEFMIGMRWEEIPDDDRESGEESDRDHIFPDATSTERVWLPPTPLEPFTTTNVAQTPSLLGLSLELLEYIAEDVDTSSLLNLRLASMELAFKLSRHFRKTCFEHLHVLLFDSSSMKNLKRICQHPSLGRIVRRITFNISIMQKHPYELPPIRPVHGATEYRPHAQCPHAARKSLEAIIRTFAKREQNVDFNISTEEFNIPVDRTVPLLSHTTPWGIRRLARLSHGSPLVFSGNDNTQAFRILMKVFLKNKYPVQSLCLGGNHDPFGPWAFGRYLIKHTREDLFKHLKCLSLTLPGPNVGRCMARWMGVLDLIAEAQGLESLRLEIENTYSSRVADKVIFRCMAHQLCESATCFQCLGMSGTLHNIREMTLKGHDIPKQSLLAWIRKHSSTLKRLCLCEIIDSTAYKLRDDPNIRRDIFEAHGGEDFELKMSRVYEGTRRALNTTHVGFKLPQWETSNTQTPSTVPTSEDYEIKEAFKDFPWVEMGKEDAFPTQSRMTLSYL